MKKFCALERFRLDNGLTKKQLADYLHVSQTYIGRACAGGGLSLERMRALKENGMGWDVTALLGEGEEAPEPVDRDALLEEFRAGMRKLEAALDECRAASNLYREAIAEKDRQIERLCSILENLSSK